MEDLGLGRVTETLLKLPWHVAHTRPRCEKKLVHYCRNEGFDVTLPCVRSVKRYERKTVTFEKPLFPGYVFFRSEPERVQSVYYNEHAANVLTVFDQDEFERQLGGILMALESGCVLGSMNLSAGQEVRITAGPLAGMTGVILQVSNPL